MLVINKNLIIITKITNLSIITKNHKHSYCVNNDCYFKKLL